MQPKLYPVQCTDLVPGGYGYTVRTLTGPVKVTGYGVAEATIEHPDGRIGKVGYWAYYAPGARHSIRTKFGMLGSCLRYGPRRRDAANDPSQYVYSHESGSASPESSRSRALSDELLAATTAVRSSRLSSLRLLLRCLFLTLSIG